MRIYYKTNFIFISVIVIMLTFTTIAFAEESKKPIEHVFLISVGGLNYEGFISTPTPNLKLLANEGVIDEKTLAIRADTLEAGEASLLTGAFPEQHKHLTVKDRVEVESIFDVLNKNHKSIMVIDGSGGKLKSFDHGNKKYVALNSKATDKELFNTLFESFEKEKTFFNYIYFNNPADALLRVDEEAYYKALKEFDIQLAVFIKKLKDSGYYNKSMIIITSARSSSPSDYVPLIIVGPQTKYNKKISGSMVVDVAPTIASYMNFKKPFNTRGIALYNTFSVSDDKVKELNNKWINELQQDRVTNWNEYYKLESQLNRTIRQMNSIKEERESIFDFFGEKEQTIAKLKTRLYVERGIFSLLLLILIFGYFIEYKLLKKKFLLFK